MHRIYFDNAATTPLDPEVIEVMVQAMRDNFGNGVDMLHAPADPHGPSGSMPHLRDGPDPAR